MIDEKKWELIITGSRALRVNILEQEPMLFAIYYFPEFFTFAIPSFHKDFYYDCTRLTNGTIDEIMWCVFREGAKSSIAKIALLTWVICFVKKRYVNWDSYDSDNAESVLFDVTVALQTNKRLISDFGHLFFQKKAKTALSEAKMKRIKNFVTEVSGYGPGVRVSAFSTQESTRGRLFNNMRPDLWILDDFENTKTKDSPLVTEKIIAHINELRSGLPAGASVLYLCNFITDTGSVAYLMENMKNNPNRAIVRFIPIIDAHGKIMWPSKYVLTDKEAAEINRTITEPKLHKLSIESRRRSLGTAVFETEMMLNPSKAGDLYFDRDMVNASIAKAREPSEVIGGLKMWAKFDPSHFYGMGADTAEGIGADSNASAIIDLKRRPNLLVASFEDSNLSNTVFGWELKRQGALFGYPFLVPELNQTGYGTIAELQNAQYPNIYVREVKNHTTNKIQRELGWKATVGTKSEVLGNFKKAFEDGDLEILDIGLLTEMKFFSKAELRLVNRQKGASRHYDKLRAAALAWEARHHVTTSSKDKKDLFKVPGQDQPYKP